MDPRLYKAAKSGNIFVLVQLVNENPSLLTKLTPQENTPLHIAVQFGQKTVVAEIYNRCRCLLTRKNLDGDTPLHFAARYGHFSIVDFLVRQLLSTPENGNLEILRQGNNENNTILHEAVRNGHLIVVGFLLKVDPKLACFENHAGESPLFLAAREGLKDILNQILILSPSSAHGGSDGLTTLHAAVMERRSDIMEHLLRAKPELVTEIDHHGRTPLYYAAAHGSHHAVQRLLELEPSNAYILDQYGHSPLHIAAKEGRSNVMEKIICYCPDSGEILDPDGRNALHLAVLAGKAKVVRCILETAELERLINQADNDGNTPLHLATIEQQTRIVRYLMWDERVNQRARNKRGLSVFDIDGSIREACITFPGDMITCLGRTLRNLPTGMPNKKDLLSSKQVDNAKMQSYQQMGHTLSMVAILIATITFAAAFTIPGGFNNNSGPKQGQALLESSKALKWFVVSDSIAVTSSITAACVIFWGAVSSSECYIYYLASATVLTWISLQSTAIAFTTGIRAVLRDQSFVGTLDTTVGLAFHVSNLLFLFQLARILHNSEICQLLISRFCKMKSKSRKLFAPKAQ